MMTQTIRKVNPRRRSKKEILSSSSCSPVPEEEEQADQLGDTPGLGDAAARQPGPYGPLVIGRVPLWAAAPITSPVGRISGGEGPETAGGEEVAADGAHDGGLFLRFKG
jgi:hypothetical protein